MKKTKRFTPDLFDRYEELGRGTGTFEDYIAFHKVSRNDPSSIGRSHLDRWCANGHECERAHDLLSDGEKVAFLFAIMLPNIVDIREQFHLQFQYSHHELLEYNIYGSENFFEGTDQISKKLKIKHPRVNGNGRSAPWPMTTDLLLTLKNDIGQLYLLAISCKPKNFVLKGRSKLLLEIERHYWKTRGVDWLLITPDIYDYSVGLTLRSAFPWSLGESIEKSLLVQASEQIIQQNGIPLTLILQKLSISFNNMELAQRVFWQCVMSGLVPIDLRRGWRPHVPIQILSKNDFSLLNPISSRRTTWI
jgi:hypothetical protein